ncbi:hypothetical protein LSM04_006097 [Trypanosoma melophagium]|uniref:uncharacterized protein n=1 Tax=Trypanosoma melophagium TaxID=715481 RepID=UPI00351AAE66|nr:hypothetical protein LSM04_006097 [Trypanosoma melophagium]
MSHSNRSYSKEDMIDVKQKIAQETSKRKEVERTLEHLRSQGLLATGKAATFQTLLEPERVSEHSLQLSEGVRHAEELEANIKQSVQELTEYCSQFQQNLHNMNLEVRSLQHDIIMKEDANAVEMAQTNAQQIEEFPLLDLSGMKKTVEVLRRKVAMVETTEAAMGCLAACSHRTLHELWKLSVTLNSTDVLGKWKETEDDTDSFDSEDGADSTPHSPVVLTSAKSILDRCDLCLCTIWSGLSRVAFDEAHHRRQKDMRYEEAYVTVERDFEMTMQKCDAHLQQLRDELEMWKIKHSTFESLVKAQEVRDKKTREKFIQIITVKMKIMTVAEKKDEIDVIESFATEARLEKASLEDDHHHLQATKESLEKKLDLATNDYKCVGELKHEYRDLELKKSELVRINEQLRKKNRMMNLTAWKIGMTLPLMLSDK